MSSQPPPPRPSRALQLIRLSFGVVAAPYWQILVLVSLALGAMLSREHAIAAEEHALSQSIVHLRSELAWQANQTHSVLAKLQAERAATTWLRSRMHSYLTHMVGQVCHLCATPRHTPPTASFSHS